MFFFTPVWLWYLILPLSSVPSLWSTLLLRLAAWSRVHWAKLLTGKSCLAESSQNKTSLPLSLPLSAFFTLWAATFTFTPALNSCGVCWGALAYCDFWHAELGLKDIKYFFAASKLGWVFLLPTKRQILLSSVHSCAGSRLCSCASPLNFQMLLCCVNATYYAKLTFSLPISLF